MSFKLKSVAALAMAGALAACGAQVEATNGSDLETGHVDAAQAVGPFSTAIEFTPKTNPDMQCVTVISRSSHDGNGGITCWSKPPAVTITPAHP